MNDFIVFLAIVTACSLVAYGAGWYHASYAVKRDARKLKQALAESNAQYKSWSESDAGKMYQKGFTAGVAMVLDTVDGLVQRSKNDASS